MAADGSHLDVEGLAWGQGSVQQKRESCPALAVMIQAEFSLQGVRSAWGAGSVDYSTKCVTTASYSVVLASLAASLACDGRSAAVMAVPISVLQGRPRLGQHFSSTASTITLTCFLC